MKEKQEELPIDVRFKPPTYNQVQLEAQKIGLPEDEAALFYSYFQSNGWKVGRAPMKSWKDALNGWRLRWIKTTAPERPRSLWELSKILEAKQRIADKLKLRYRSEVAGGVKWTCADSQKEYAQLMKDINLITQRISEMK